MPIDRPYRAGPCVRLRLSSCFQSWEQNGALPLATVTSAVNREEHLDVDFLLLRVDAVQALTLHLTRRVRRAQAMAIGLVAAEMEKRRVAAAWAEAARRPHNEPPPQQPPPLPHYEMVPVNDEAGEGESLAGGGFGDALNGGGGGGSGFGGGGGFGSDNGNGMDDNARWQQQQQQQQQQRGMGDDFGPQRPLRTSQVGRARSRRYHQATAAAANDDDDDGGTHKGGQR